MNRDRKTGEGYFWHTFNLRCTLSPDDVTEHRWPADSAKAMGMGPLSFPSLSSFPVELQSMIITQDKILISYSLKFAHFFCLASTVDLSARVSGARSQEQTE